MACFYDRSFDPPLDRAMRDYSHRGCNTGIGR